MLSATIFYYDDLWMAKKACCDVRFDSQKLPTGVVVCGFAMFRNGKYHETVKSPGITDEQKRQYEAVLAYARGVVRDDVQDWDELQDQASLDPLRDQWGCPRQTPPRWAIKQS